MTVRGGTHQLSSTFFNNVMPSPFLKDSSTLVFPVKSNLAFAIPFLSGFSGDDEGEITYEMRTRFTMVVTFDRRRIYRWKSPPTNSAS